jgi:chaperonin GroES
MAIQPLADRIVVKVLEAKEVTKGGILLPETAKEKPQEGKVIAVGKGKTLPCGQIQTMEVKVGDRILFEQYGGKEITTTDGEELFIINEENVVAIVK